MTAALRPPPTAPTPAVSPGVIAIRVRYPGRVDRLITEDAPAPAGDLPMGRCCDSPSDWGRAPRTFADPEEAEVERREWERHQGPYGYRFDLVERVMLPSWRAIGGTR